MDARLRATLICFWFTSTAIPALWAASPPITAASFAPGGRHIVLGSQAGLELRTWPELTLERTLMTQLTNIHDVGFSADGKNLAAAGGTPGEEGILEIWTWPSGERISGTVAHSDVIYKIAWRSNGQQIACASADREVSLIDVPAARVAYRLAGHSRAVTSLVYLPGDQFLVSGSVDTTLRVWDLSTRSVVRSLTNHTGEVRDIALQPRADPDTPVVASAGADRTIRLWQPFTGRLLRFARLPSEALDVDWTADAAQLVVSCADGHVRVIDAQTVAVTKDVAALEGWAYTLAVPPTGLNAFVGGAGGKSQAVKLLSR
jgi:WD40 repeat protein